MAFVTIEFATTVNLPMLRMTFKGTGVSVTGTGIFVPDVSAPTAREGAVAAFHRVNKNAYPTWVRDVTRIAVRGQGLNDLTGMGEIIESYIPRSEVAKIKNWSPDEVERRLRVAT